MDVEFDDGVLTIDGKHIFIVASDYPYYRDSPENWADRLEKLRNAGVNVITFYIPWRHHLISDNGQDWFDFDGRTRPNRNVRLFIKLCEKQGLYIMIKPGPFIHAETNFNGLPDCVSPQENEDIEGMLDSRYMQVTNEKALPSPVGENFKKGALAFLREVNDELIAPHLHPAGKIICAQILNEGMYSNINQSPLAYDYSKTSVGMFRHFLEEKYKTIDRFNSVHSSDFSDFSKIEPPTVWHKPEKVKESAIFLDWSEFQAEYVRILYENYAAPLSSTIPHIANICGSQSCQSGLDYWLSRVQPERWHSIEYAYTDWIGTVAYDDEAFFKYLTLCKRAKGPNVEENWGFSILYNHIFQFPVTPFYHTLLAIANGATGFSVYTGVETADWDDNIDSIHAKPYPDSSPITADGKTRYKYKILELITEYLRRYGNELLASNTVKAATYGIYPPYAYAASWANAENEWAPENPPRSGFRGLDSFIRNMRSQNYDFDIINIQATEMRQLLEAPSITVVGGFYMEEAVQRRLAEYVKRGGTLILLREVPRLNESFEPCDILAKEIYCHTITGVRKNVVLDGFDQELNCVYTLGGIPGKALYHIGSKPVGYVREYGSGKAYFVGYNAFDDEISDVFLDIMRNINVSYDIVVPSSSTQVWNRHYGNNISHIFIFSKSNISKWHSIKIKNRNGYYDLLKIKLCARSSAVLRLKDGAVTACLAKGINECDKISKTTEVKYNGNRLCFEKPTDSLLIHDENNSALYSLCLTVSRKTN